MAFGLEMSRHRESHDPQTDKGTFGHVDPPSLPDLLELAPS
jgi:hypothetical protein